MRDETYYCNQSFGDLEFTSDGRVRVVCDQGIVKLYAWLCKKHGMPVIPNYKFGAHISFIKGETLPPEFWGKPYDPIEFWYSSHIRSDNGYHTWLDVWSDDLHALRAMYGLPPKVKMSYHLTIGRL